MNVLRDPAWWALLISVLAFFAAAVSAKQARKSAVEAKRANDFVEKHREPWVQLEPSGTTARIRNNSGYDRYNVIIQSSNGEESHRDHVGPWQVIEVQTMPSLAQAPQALSLRWQDEKDSEEISKTWEA